LKATLERCNAACNEMSKRGLEAGKTRQHDLHKLLYADARQQFAIAAQVAVRCIAKVADAYTTQQANRQSGPVHFRKHASQPYDDRIFRFMAGYKALNGREKIPFVCGTRQQALLRYRSRYPLKRATLQYHGTKGAKRRLTKLSGKEARFRKHINNCISKEIVATAERSRCATAPEDLTHIRKRGKARKAQRSRLAGWSFSQPRGFVAYKVVLKGIPAVAIDPRNMSRTCPECGVAGKRNRKTQDKFSCIECGHEAVADFVGARNIRASGAGLLRSLGSLSSPLGTR
jgi:putative transposase